MSVRIRVATKADANQIAEIYNHYVEHTHVTFDVEPNAPEVFEARIAADSGHHPWLVAEEEGVVLGFASSSPWKSRCAYERAVETSLYLRESTSGRGLGTRLYRELLELLRARGVHTILGGIALPNDVSRHMHEKFGFERVGVMREVGRKFGRWIDVEYWQLRFPESVDS